MYIWRSNERSENGDKSGRSEISGEEESRDYLASCMQMTWFSVLNWNKT